MQKTFVKIISRKILTAAVVTGTSAFDSSADSNNNMEIVSSNIHSSVEFKGTADDKFLFDVIVGNPDAENFTLEIRNDNNVILFSEDYNETKLLKEIKLQGKEFTTNYNFIIKTSNKEPEQTFVVSIINKVVNEVAA